MRTREGGSLHPGECPAVLAARCLVEKCLNFLFAATLGRIEIMENFGVITVQSSRVSGLCAARDHVSAQYPVINVYFVTGTVQATLVNQ
jgi:hypothetical protein